MQVPRESSHAYIFKMFKLHPLQGNSTIPAETSFLFLHLSLQDLSEEPEKIKIKTVKEIQRTHKFKRCPIIIHIIINI